MTLEEQLESVQRAIAAIEASGQETDIEVSQNRRRIVRAKLQELYVRESKLRLAIRRRQGGGIYYVQ
jgi:hypothetical protein